VTKSIDPFCIIGNNFSELGGYNGAGFQAKNIDPNTPNLKTIFREKPPASASEDNQRSFSTTNVIGVLDLISEGPIEGLVTGSYIYGFTNKTTGSIGYSSATFIPFNTFQNSRESSSIFWNDTPITDIQGYNNFQYSNYKYTYGEKNNEHTIWNPYIYLYEDRYNYFGKQVDKGKIPLETTITRSINERLYGAYKVDETTKVKYPKTYYIYNTEVSAIQVNIKVNALYEQILQGTATAGDTEWQNGEIFATVYRILSDNSLVLLDTSKYSPYTPTYYSSDVIYYEGKITSPTVFTYHINLRPFAENFPNFPLFSNQIGWAVTLVVNTLEGAGTTLQTDVALDSFNQVFSDRFTYPSCAAVYSRFDARYFGQIPERSYKVRLLKVKVPVNYDPITKTYSGAWNGKFKLAWTDNPAWCFYDLITNNRYGLGKYIKEELTDKWTLYEVSKYCDQLVSNGVGGLEPRFTCNLYIATKEEAYKVLNDMASIFRGILYYSAGQIIAAQDSPKKSIYLFNNSNVVGGAFNYSDASRRARRTVAYVRYNDRNDNYKPAIEYVEDRDSILKYGIREKDIAAFGCTSKTQARRIGKWLLITDNEDTELIDFKVGIEGNLVRPGDVISVYDQDRKNRVYAGRTLELKQNYAILDIPYNTQNNYILTGLSNSFKFNIVTPTYNLNLGTQLGDLYSTGFNVTSDGADGINSSFIKNSQIQKIDITNPSSYVTSGYGIYSDYIKINFPINLSTDNYNLSENTIWSIDIDTATYKGGLDISSKINNDLNKAYEGYYLEPFLNKQQDYRIISMKENEDQTFSINALQYNEKKYDDIDNSSQLILKPIKPDAPNTPGLYLTGIFRSSPYLTGSILANSPTGSYGVPYTSNQTGINSIIYQIKAPSDPSSVSLYYVYIKSGQFESDSIYSQYLKGTSSPADLLNKGLDSTSWIQGNIPPYVTPQGTGVYYFRVYAANSLGERSNYFQAYYNFSSQASIDTVQASGVFLL
jgi:hypothetical protein